MRKYSSHVPIYANVVPIYAMVPLLRPFMRFCAFFVPIYANFSHSEDGLKTRNRIGSIIFRTRASGVLQLSVI